MHYIIGVVRFWNDLGPIYGQGMTWTVRLMPQVQPSNSLLNPDRWYYMLTSHIEDNRRPSEVPIYFEVEWVTPQTRHRGIHETLDSQTDHGSALFANTWAACTMHNYASM